MSAWPAGGRGALLGNCLGMGQCWVWVGTSQKPTSGGFFTVGAATWFFLNEPGWQCRALGLTGLAGLWSHGRCLPAFHLPQSQPAAQTRGLRPLCGGHCLAEGPAAGAGPPSCKACSPASASLGVAPSFPLWGPAFSVSPAVTPTRQAARGLESRGGADGAGTPGDQHSCTPRQP